MHTPQETLKRFDEKFPHKLGEVIDDFGSTVKNDIRQFQIQSHIEFLESEVERLASKIEPVGYDYDDRARGYNQAIEDQITHLTSLITSSRELLTK